ncbi:hypothetical protein diail_6331 [Diaporthe ilicicola]|nr:hypothetical protein diail_6331 [Diaporthe ilicicola]
MDLTPKTTDDKTFAKKDHHHLRPKPQRRLSRRQKVTICSTLFISWFLIFLSFSGSANPPLPATSVSRQLRMHRFSCTDAFWPSSEQCGKGGVNCVPDVSGQFPATTMAFRCPANCVRDAAPAARPHLVGTKDVTQRPVVIGGPIYRGDSELCAAAVHAGVLDDAKGGCGVVKRMGQTNSFMASYMYDVESISVKTYFPLTFNFPTTNEEIDGKCPDTTDRSWALPYVSVGHTVLFFQITGSTGARALWLTSVVTAHFLRWRSGSATWVPSQPNDPGSVPIPEMLEPEIDKQTLTNSQANITFKWATPTPPGIEGISMLVDDVERERLFFRDAKAKDGFLWKRGPQAFVDIIRFGYVKDGKVLRYSPAGTWLLDDSWTGIGKQAMAEQ